MNSFKQHLRETREVPSDPQDDAPRTLRLTVSDFIEALESFEKDGTVEIRLDCPEPSTHNLWLSAGWHLC
jgi:hypothetical protein